MLPREIERYDNFGLPIFPCLETKAPAHDGWQDEAVRYIGDRAKHEEWFVQNGFKVGLRTGGVSGLAYIDCDNRENAVALYRELGSKIKAIIQTPRGFHFPFRTPDEPVRNAVRAKIMGALADVRGEGGQVISPPSTISGKVYHFIHGFELDPKKLEVFDPRWIEQKTVRREPIHEDDTLRRITRARAWLAKHEPAISGQGGHKQMFSACCWMFQKFQLTMDKAWPLILEYNERCVPPFSEKELRHKLLDASQKPVTH